MKIDEQKSIGELAWEIADRTETSDVFARFDKWKEEVDEALFAVSVSIVTSETYEPAFDELADVLITTLSFAQALGEPNLIERAREKALKVLAGLE